MSGFHKSIVLDVWQVNWITWKASWRKEDDIGLDGYTPDQVGIYALNEVTGLTRNRAIGTARYQLQARVNAEVKRIRKEREAAKSHERVRVMIDVTELREEQNA